MVQTFFLIRILFLILLAFSGIQMMRGRDGVALRRLLIFFGGMLLLYLIAEPAIYSWLQYRTWQLDPLSRHLLPPYHAPSYFLGYVFFHFWLWRLLGAGITVCVFLLADRFIVRPSDGFRMNREEAVVIAFGIALAGWPYLLFYLFALLLFYFLILLSLTARARVLSRRRRASEPSREFPRAGGGINKEKGDGGEEFAGTVRDALLVEAFLSEPARFPIALPATLALFVIPFAHFLLVSLGLGVLQVTSINR